MAPTKTPSEPVPKKAKTWKGKRRPNSAAATPTPTPAVMPKKSQGCPRQVQGSSGSGNQGQGRSSMSQNRKPAVVPAKRTLGRSGSVRVCVGNLPDNFDLVELQEIFETYGNFAGEEIIKHDRKNGRTLIYFTLRSARDAELAVKVRDESCHKGRPMRIKIVDQGTNSPPPSPPKMKNIEPHPNLRPASPGPTVESVLNLMDDLRRPRHGAGDGSRAGGGFNYNHNHDYNNGARDRSRSPPRRNIRNIRELSPD